MSDGTTRITHRRTEIWSRLVDEHSVFSSYIDMFVFTGCLGYYKERYEVEYQPVEDEDDGEILWMHLSNKDLFRAVMAAIAYQHTGDPESLVKPEMQLQVMAQYAVGGAEFLSEELRDVKGDPTDTLLNIIQNHRDTDREQEQDSELQRILDSFDQDMLNAESD